MIPVMLSMSLLMSPVLAQETRPESSGFFGWVFSLLGEEQPVRGSGAVLSEERQVPPFHAVQLAGSCDFSYQLAPVRRVVVMAQSEVLPRVDVRVVDGVLRVSLKNVLLSVSQPIRVVASGPALDGAVLTGSGNMVLKGVGGKYVDLEVKGSGQLKASGSAERLAARITGSGAMQLDDIRAHEIQASLGGSGDWKARKVNAKRVVVTVKGSGSVWASGEVDKVDTVVHGSGDVNLTSLHAQSVSAKVAGTGNIYLHARDSASAQSYGSGDITVSGNPARRNVSRYGSGAIHFP